MAATTVVEGTADGQVSGVGDLFNGLRFFLVQRLPQRSRYVNLVETNGGRVVKLEAQADHIIADHFRADCPPGSLSYNFIDAAVRSAELPDPNDHLAGPPPGTVRALGSIVPGKGTRTPFTQEDDRILWQWVQDCAKKGGSMKGNTIYQQLESKNSRHTFQAWRDRYIKRLMDNPPPAGIKVTVSANAPPTPPVAQDENETLQAGHAGELQDLAASEQQDGDDQGEESLRAEEENHSPSIDAEPAFTEEDHELLLGMSNDIIDIDESLEDEAWAKWHRTFPNHPAQSWRTFWQEKVRPVYLEEEEERKAQRRRDRKRKRKLQEVASTSSQAQAHKKMKSRLDGVSETDTPASEQARSNEQPATDAIEAISALPVVLLAGDNNGDQEHEEAQNEPTSELNRQADAQLVDEQARGDLLTQENLASQQAQHKTRSSRAADLQIDDENEDGDQQDALLHFLQGTVRSFAQAQHQSAGEASDVLPANQEAVNEPAFSSQAVPPHTNEDAPLSLHDLLASPQQNIDAIFNEAINWPDSPDRSERIPGLEMQFETQVTYPKLPPSYIDSQDRQESHVSQSFRVNEGPAGRTSPAERPSSMEVMEHSRVRQHTAREPKESDLPAEVVEEEEENSHVTVDSADDIEALLDVSDEEEPDLSIPEPRQRSDGEPDFEVMPESFFATAAQRSGNAQEAEESEENDEGMSATSSSSSSSQSMRSDASEDGDNRNSVKMLETQDIVNAETQQPDLAMPLPSDSENEIAEQGHGQSDQADTARSHWSHVENAILLRAINKGWEVRQILKKYQLDRSKSAVRNRRSLLERKFPTQASRDMEIEQLRISMQRTRQSRGQQTRSSQADDLAEDDELEDELALSDCEEESSAEEDEQKTDSQRNLSDSQRMSDDEVNTYIDRMVFLGHEEMEVIKALKCTSVRQELADLVLLELKAGKGFPSDVPGIWSEGEDLTLESGDARGLRKLEEKHTWNECVSRMEHLEQFREDGE